MKQLINILLATAHKNAKAIAAYFAVLVTGLAAHFTLAIPDDVLLAGQSLIVAVIVWITANRE